MQRRSETRPMMPRPQSTPPPPTPADPHLSSAHREQVRVGPSTRAQPSHRHSVSSYSNLLPQPMYHPLQHKRGSTNRTPAGGPMRRISSPEVKIKSLRTAYQASQENTTDTKKKIVRRGSFQGTLKGSGGSGSEMHPGRAHSVTPRTSPLPPNSPWSTQNVAGGSGSPQTDTLTGSSHSKLGGKSGGSGTGVSAGTALPANLGEAHLSYGGSQTSWAGGGSPPDTTSQFRQGSAHSQEVSVGKIRVPLCNRGEAWQLEEEEEEEVVRRRGRGGRPSGHVDEALFTTRIPRHYFHSSHSPHPHTSTTSQSSPSYNQEVGGSGVPYHHWSLPISDRHPQRLATPTNCSDSSPNTTLEPDKKHRHQERQGSRKIMATRQERVAEWVKGQSDATAAISMETGTSCHMTQSLPRPLRRASTPDSGNRWQYPTRTFSYIQAQVHPVTAQDSPPPKGFDAHQMMSEYRRSLSNTSDGGEQQSDSVFSTEVQPPQKKQRPRPLSSPHPHRARTRSSPNPAIRWNVNKKVKNGGGVGVGGDEVERGIARDSVHPDKRFSTGNILEENQMVAKFSGRRSTSPLDEKGRVICHAPGGGAEEETSSEDTGGQSDSESVLRKNKGQQRSKSSSGGIISKIARRLGRVSSVKPDSHNSSEDLPTSGEGEGGREGRESREGLVQSANHNLKVPTPRMQQKKLKSMSTSHLETSFDGSSHYRQNSLTDRYSPDYFEGRGQDDGWYRQGTPPPGPGTPYGTPYGTPKMSRASSRSRQRSAEPDPDSLSGFTAVFRSGSKRNLSADIHETLLDFVEQGNFDGVEQLLESNSVTDLNITSEDDFTLVDLAAMLGHHDITKLLLSRGARDSTRFSRDPFSRFRHILTLLSDTERELDSLRYEVVVQNSSGGSSSVVRDMERRLRQHEWKAHLFKRMKANYESAELPDPPSEVALHVSSSRSLTVKFSEPLHSNGAPITRYKIEWCQGSDQFAPIVGEFVLTDLRTSEYIIPDLNKGDRYFVRVSAFNMKGFGHPQLATPSSAVPSSWHDLTGSRPRFEGSTDNIHIIAAQLNMSLSHSPPVSPPPISGTPSTYRKTNVKKSISKLFGTNIRFQKSLRPGVYISSLVYSDDSRVVVTMDEQLPTIEISDSPATSSIGTDFVWLAKVACTWDQVKGMAEMSENYTSSPAIHSRNKMLHAILELQTALGLQDLGLLHPVPYRDSHGAVVFVIVQYVKDMRSVQSSSLKWMNLPRLWKKRPQATAGDLQAIPVPDQLILDAQEIIAHHGNSTRPLSRGLYLGYLKARSTVASMKVICSREYPNVLPHHKIRENPNISQEEWIWLKSLAASPPTLSPSTSSSSSSSSTSRSPPPPPPPTTSGPHSLQRLLPTTVDTFLHNLGIFKEDAEKHQLYCQEVIELSEDISLILILPPSDQVCTPPGSTDHFAKLSDFVALPINTFEIMQLYTYQKAFMTKFSTVSARLDIELLTSQQKMREAFSKAEVTAAKQLKEQLESFQERTDSAWKEMRWIEEAVQKGRNQSTFSSASSLLPVKVLRDATRTNIPGGLRGSPAPEPNSGYLRVFPAYTTGLVNGTSVRLFITESTTTTEVIRLVVQQLERARIDKGIKGPRLTEEDMAGFYLVARLNGKETALDYDYTPLQLQSNPQHKWRLLVRRVSEERRTSSEQTTSV